MSITCPDFCDHFISLICARCPHYGHGQACMPEDDEANHDQMMVCLSFMVDKLRGSKYPKELEYPW